MQTIKKIAKYLKHQRQKLGLSLANFGKKSRLTTSFLSRLESGDYNDIRFTVVEKIAAGLDISLQELLGKCKIIDPGKLPTLDFYLREKYQLPADAVKDVSQFIDFVIQKNRVIIKKLKSKNKAYRHEP